MTFFSKSHGSLYYYIKILIKYEKSLKKRFTKTFHIKIKYIQVVFGGKYL